MNRAVSIAQLPITALQNQQTNLVQEKQLGTGFESAVSALAASVKNLGALGASQAMSATSSIEGHDRQHQRDHSVQLLDHQHHFSGRGSFGDLQNWIRQRNGDAGFEQWQFGAGRGDHY